MAKGRGGKRAGWQRLAVQGWNTPATCTLGRKKRKRMEEKVRADKWCCVSFGFRADVTREATCVIACHVEGQRGR